MSKPMMKWKIRAIIERHGHDLEKLANLLGIAYQTLSRKMNGFTPFTLAEVKIMMDTYNLTPEEVVDIFLGEDCIIPEKSRYYLCGDADVDTQNQFTEYNDSIGVNK